MKLAYIPADRGFEFGRVVWVEGKNIFGINFSTLSKSEHSIFTEIFCIE